MKQIFIAVLILISATVTAQESSYNAKIGFDLTDSIENNVTFKRKAFYEAMIYNQRVNSVALQYSIDFYNNDGTKKMKTAKGYAREVIVGTKNYVLTSNGTWVGTQDQMLAAYGVHKNGNVDSPYVKNPGSQFYQLTTPCMTEYDYFIKQVDNPSKISALIKAIGQREAAAGKLD